jgi:hypothetical protein
MGFFRCNFQSTSVRTSETGRNDLEYKHRAAYFVLDIRRPKANIREKVQNIIQDTYRYMSWGLACHIKWWVLRKIGTSTPKIYILLRNKIIYMSNNREKQLDATITVY